MTTALATGFAVLMTRISKYKKLADEVNQVCMEKGCLPAFDIQLSLIQKVISGLGH
jgi:hypothetical protein